MSVAALIVSHNRKNLLDRALRSMRAQTRQPDLVLVVDNDSSDGAPEMVCEKYPEVRLISTQANLGGAGGFAAGIDHLIQGGFSYAWVMDDDAYPESDALELVMRAMTAFPGEEPGFVASAVVTPEGVEDPGMYPEVPDAANHYRPRPAGAIPVAYTMFVGALINLERARETFLPIADFFIWWDDTEYTARLQSIAGGFLVPQSVVRHPDKPELKDLQSRLRHDIRNRIWIMRDERLGSKYAKAKARGALWLRIRRQAVNAQSKWRYARYLVQGVIEGLVKRPRLQMPAVLVSTRMARESSDK